MLLLPLKPKNKTGLRCFLSLLFQSRLKPRWLLCLLPGLQAPPSSSGVTEGGGTPPAGRLLPQQQQQQRPDETNVLPPPDGDTPPVKQSCHIFHAAARSLKRRALAAVIVLIYLFMAQTEGTAPPSAPLLATYGRHLSPFAAIGLNDFIN